MSREKSPYQINSKFDKAACLVPSSAFPCLQKTNSLTRRKPTQTALHLKRYLSSRAIQTPQNALVLKRSHWPKQNSADGTESWRGAGTRAAARGKESCSPSAQTAAARCLPRARTRSSPARRHGTARHGNTTQHGTATQNNTARHDTAPRAALCTGPSRSSRRLHPKAAQRERHRDSFVTPTPSN